MRISQRIQCDHLSCPDVNHDGYVVPKIEVKPAEVSIVLISEAAPVEAGDYYYARGHPLFEETTVQAFNDAGARVSSIRDILALGVYLTTAVKCAKESYGIKTGTVKACSLLLERELALFPNARVLLLMGDVAIQSLNAIAVRAGEPRVIPAGSTYRLRGPRYEFRGMRVLPSYLQAGPSFFIEKSKRKMIAEDIAAALTLHQ